MEQVPIKIQLLIRIRLAGRAPLRVVLVLNIYAHHESNELVQNVKSVSIKIPLHIRILPVNLALLRAAVVLNLLLVQQKQIDHVLDVAPVSTKIPILIRILLVKVANPADRKI